MTVHSAITAPWADGISGAASAPAGGASGELSPFETALQSLGPVVLNKFRDANFATNIQDYSGNGNHLVKQNATAARSSVPTRTTHPGGAYFPAVTYDNWASQGTPYEGPTGLISSGTAATLVMSVRVIKDESGGANSRLFGVAAPDAGEGGTNDIFTLFCGEGTSEGKHKYTSTTGGQVDTTTDVTERIDDGVSRLIIARYENGSIYRLTTSKPGYELLQEDTGSAASGTGLSTQARTLLMNGRLNTSTGSNETCEFICDAAALYDYDIGPSAESDLHSKWSDEVAGAGYYPSMMQYDGSTGYYSSTFTSSGNKVTTVLRVNRSSFTGDTVEAPFFIRSAGPSTQRTGMYAYSSDYTADTTLRNKMTFTVQNSTPTTICHLISNVDICDGEEHIIIFAFDGDTGTATLTVDGVDADDTGHGSRTAPTTGTLGSGASTLINIGENAAATGFYWGGEIGFVGHREAYLTNYTDFINSAGNSLPAPIDEKNWTEWGAQPLFWSHTGQMDNNKGSAGDMTKNGTITMTQGGEP